MQQNITDTVTPDQSTPEQSIGTRVWQKSKWLMKGGLIALITILLLIPTEYVTSLIREREATQQEATREVTGKWAGRQEVSGPVLVLPYFTTPAGTPDSVAREQFLYVLPDTVQMDARVTPMEKHRGVYQVMLYSAGIDMKGEFGALPLEQFGISPERVKWEQAFVQIGVSDPQGVNAEVTMRLNEQALRMEATDDAQTGTGKGFRAPVKISAGQPLSFSGNLQLNGSEGLQFIPVGKETKVKVTSSWSAPSFTGSQLPQQAVTDSGFQASWKSLSYNRSYPQAWTALPNNASYDLRKSAFGVELFIPVNGYQKVLRSVKYAMLCIVLTFAAFFLIENVSGRNIHPFQYALVGLALVLFYTLLLSISEYTGFNLAYLIASIATIGLITWFVTGLFGSGRLTGILAAVLVLLYAYLFSILQLEDYSLLLGSIGLFLSLGVVMRFSRKLNW